jgi:hypothetical protein
MKITQQQPNTGCWDVIPGFMQIETALTKEMLGLMLVGWKQCAFRMVAEE